MTKTRITVARELLRLAREVLGAWIPLNKDVDVSRRNIDILESLTSFAPRISAIVRKVAADSLREAGLEVSPGDLRREWSEYLTVRLPGINSNKYHYYAIFSAPSLDGDRYVAMNCSGRIGFVERAYDLTRKFFGGPVFTMREAELAINSHRRGAIRKGYQPQPMVRG